MATTGITTQNPSTDLSGSSSELPQTGDASTTSSTTTTTEKPTTTEETTTTAYPDTVESSTSTTHTPYVRHTLAPRKKRQISENEARKILKDYLRRNLGCHDEKLIPRKKIRVGPEPDIPLRTNGTSRIRLLIQAYRLFQMSGTFSEELTPEEEEMLLKRQHLTDELKAKIQYLRDLSHDKIEQECERIELEKLRQMSESVYSPRRIIYRENKSSMYRYNAHRAEIVPTDAMRTAYKEYEKPPFETKLRYEYPPAKSLPPLNKDNELWLIPLPYEGSPPRCTLKMCQSLDKPKPTKCCPIQSSTPRPPVKPHKSRKEWEDIIEKKQKTKAAAEAAKNGTAEDEYGDTAGYDEEEDDTYYVSTTQPPPLPPQPPLGSLPPGGAAPVTAATTTALTTTTPKPTMFNIYLHPKRKYTIHPRFRTRPPTQPTRRTIEETTTSKEEFDLKRGRGPLRAFNYRRKDIKRHVRQEVRTRITTTTSTTKTIRGGTDSEIRTVESKDTVTTLEPESELSDESTSTPPPELANASDEE